jgi:truncated hemoglobin YjbI/plastocyanin
MIISRRMRLLPLLVLLSVRAQAATLYERLGGKAGVAAVVDELARRAAADARLKARFVDVDLARFKSAVADFVCAQSGGGCAVPGADLRGAHAGMQIVEAEWNAFMEDLEAALGKLNPPEKQELVNLMRSHQSEVVQPPPREAQEVDNELLEKAKQLASMLKNVGKVKPGELLEAACQARERGQRSHAEHLYSVAETLLKPEALAVIAPLFRQGGPPRVTEPPRRAEHPAQPAGAAGSSDENHSAGKASLSVTLTVDGKPRAGAVLLAGGKRHAARAGVVEIRDGRMAPRLLVVPVGSTVAFANFDPVFHNFFSKSFDLGFYKDGTERQVTFDKEGVFRVADNLHPHTASYVIVTAAPFFAAGDGPVVIKSVAPGHYKLRAVCEGAQEAVKQVDIGPGENQLTVELKRAPIEVTDKFGFR